MCARKPVERCRRAPLACCPTRSSRQGRAVNRWRLDTGGPDHLDRDVIDVAVRFGARIPVRPTRLIADGFGLARAEVDRLITEGKSFRWPG
ncbi:DUF1062 domain-containing protein [Micromonospora sp. WMMD961]|uniref:DUF1062 domain-containing protein n=1 Tax=Micromonospora sp. WMMD961 TaxID=3016100 RepID=UPI003242826D